ncbi:hypothetical protein BDN72DRAFT_242788 [Pluteus cervinus]|uniref:Uncharacterized protein n=1 Tax=Pluteus cervinus TaxID=181527 RepID=A0ACD3BF63_9AGAR|nr:hypothetical protein BDN72DRAFT_242788 [Pluteus cervinus]
METSSVFLRLRTLAFCCISLASFLWTILLCIMIYAQWNFMERAERSFIVLMLFLNIVTFVILLILLIVEFRPWLDAARFLFLLVGHIGTASAFVFWSPKFGCSSSNPDQEGTCKLLIMYTLVASWLIPVLLTTYVTGLSLMLYRRRKRTDSVPVDVYSRAHSILPIMTPHLQTPVTLTFPVKPNAAYLHSDFVSSPTATHLENDNDLKDGTRHSNGSGGRRLSKPAPYIV